mmetsp:Transcript_28175/g.41803  ORF Transcript_28175/g.41803 Transcript_28175/m.41803 type:complete len:397 (-) Transcript_28175:1-1191(-)
MKVRTNCMHAHLYELVQSLKRHEVDHYHCVKSSYFLFSTSSSIVELILISRFLPRERIVKVVRLFSAFTAPITFPRNGGYGHHSPRTSPLSRENAVLCNGQTIHSSFPSSTLTFVSSSVLSPVDFVGPVTLGQGLLSTMPVSRGVPRCGQVFDTQNTLVPSLEPITKSSNPPATTGYTSPGLILIFGHTGIHSSSSPFDAVVRMVCHALLMVVEAPSKTPSTNAPTRPFCISKILFSSSSSSSSSSPSSMIKLTSSPFAALKMFFCSWALVFSFFSFFARCTCSLFARAAAIRSFSALALSITSFSFCRFRSFSSISCFLISRSLRILVSRCSSCSGVKNIMLLSSFLFSRKSLNLALTKEILSSRVASDLSSPSDPTFGTRGRNSSGIWSASPDM